MRKRASWLWALLLAGCCGAGALCAEGPRWVTGPPYFQWPYGVPVVWFTNSPQYFTDPGDLSAYVNHAAADALVAAAANAWNVPTAAIDVTQGGKLAEHVSAANAYLGGSGPVFPQDVESSNYSAIQIAVIYDSDGSVTDMLLGSGASAPAECRQNGVTEDVDSIVPAGKIQHAILILNGRCSGPLPQQQLQLQYELERAFGRVLGVGWSQTNDNVFSYSSQPTYLQAQHWPVMHPIDILCSQYTYLCLPQPFTLRDDDVGAISELYPMYAWYSIPGTPPAPGKTWSFAQASAGYGQVTFPTGQGMQGVNVVYQREAGGTASPEPFEDVSSVTGFGFTVDPGNPVTGVVAGMAGSYGYPNGGYEGYFSAGWIPDLDPPGAYNGPMLAVVSTEAVNPLYVGTHAVGPYAMGQVEPSGGAQSENAGNQFNIYIYQWSPVPTNFAPEQAAPSCNSGVDGIETAPLAVAAGGWWLDVMCGYGHAAWSSVNMQAGRTATLEVTALDEHGLATTAKLMPVLGAWAATDATGILPTKAAAASAFNTTSLGMTATGVRAVHAQGVRLVIADERGDGRPDFAYQARMLYADSIAPAAVSMEGGQITIAGMGFRAGNEVLVNGVVMTVSSWSATTMVAVVPAESTFATRPAGPVNVAVVDLSTVGSTVMTGALTYSAAVAPDVMTLVTPAGGTVLVGVANPVSVRVTLGDGVTPVAGLPVAFSVSAGAAQLNGCTGSPCVVLTDATGLASVTATASAFGGVSVQAAAVGASVTDSFNAVARSVTPVRAVEYVAPYATVAWSPRVVVVENGAAFGGASVAWSGSARMAVSPAVSLANALGVAQAAAVVVPPTPGAQAVASPATGQACAWATICAEFTAMAVDPSAWQLVVISGAGQTVAAGTSFAPVVLMVTDGMGDPVAGAGVWIYQTVDAAEMICPARGGCPVAPVLASSQGSAISDANGLVSVTPMQLVGVGEVTNVAAATGTQGFVALSVDQGP